MTNARNRKRRAIQLIITADPFLGRRLADRQANLTHRIQKTTEQTARALARAKATEKALRAAKKVSA